MDEKQKQEQHADDQVEDLEVGKEEADDVKGGITVRKAGGKQEDYLHDRYANLETGY